MPCATAASGILVSLNDKVCLVEGLATAMQRIARDAELRRKMGRAGRQEVERLYCWDSKIEAIVEVYLQAIVQDESIERKQDVS
jgi:glycosyltransferase involved in cell wall biosynthesis